MTTIGFIGLGNMGAPMALNLMKAGHTVRGFDLVPQARDAFKAKGGNAVETLPSAVADAEVVITMLPAGVHVFDAVCGAGGVIAHAAPDTLLIDCSTIEVEVSRNVAASAAEQSLPMLDAPVSGGVSGAEAGTLTFMVGGPEAVFERAKPLLGLMGRNIIHAGDAGAGQAAKICNNMVLGVSMIAVSEAFNLADALGLDRQKLFDIASTASGQCWALTTYCPVPGPVPTSPANRDYRAGFTAAMMLKDLALAAGAAEHTRTAAPLGDSARRLYDAFCEAGGDSTDFSGIVRYLRGEAPH
ncbi:MAG: 3-hydroxyisobutyrate dehydrogenase [Pseudomonadota bacterium]